MSSTTELSSDEIAKQCAIPFKGRPRIDTTPDRVKYAYGFVINSERRYELSKELHKDRMSQFFKETDTPKQRERGMDILQAAADRAIPFAFGREIPGLPRFLGLTWSRLAFLCDSPDSGWVYVLRHNGSAAARRVPLNEEALATLKVKLGVPNQEPAWFRVYA